MTLTTATVRSKRLEPGRYLDGDGLYLVVAKGGSRSWTLRTTVNGRQREFGLGSARKVSLKAARAEARAKKEKIDHGVDLTAPVPTLATAARIVHVLHAPSWTSPKYSHQWLTDLRNHCGGIMNVQVDRLTSAHVLSVLEPRWNSNPKLARSLRQRLSLIGAWIVAQGYLQTNPAGEVLDGVLPRRKPPVRHFASTPSDEAAAALAALKALDTPAALAIRFAILTATRSNETRGARWTEIDLDDALWTVPTERTKMRRPHRVPLSTAALAVVEEARTLPASDDLVFPSRRGQIIHHSTIALALRTAGLDTTLHGFRATFRSWALENGADWAASELALAHELGNAVTQAYARSDMLDQRRGLMERWGQHLVTRQIEDA